MKEHERKGEAYITCIISGWRESEMFEDNYINIFRKRRCLFCANAIDYARKCTKNKKRDIYCDCYVEKITETCDNHRKTLKRNIGGYGMVRLKDEFLDFTGD
jgi:hypothetical protein